MEGVGRVRGSQFHGKVEVSLRELYHANVRRRLDL
jgi:hypothetical protein